MVGEQNKAAMDMVQGMSGSQAGVVQALNNKMTQSLGQITEAESEKNRQLMNEEARMGLQASTVNASAELERQKFNKTMEYEGSIEERNSRLADLQQIGLVTAGNYTDEMKFRATERLANALDETGSYTRYTLLEALRRDPAFKGMSDSALKEFATAYYNSRERTNEKTNVGYAKFGGPRKYTTRLGELSKRKNLNFSK
jgi:hypothetical protein